MKNNNFLLFLLIAISFSTTASAEKGFYFLPVNNAKILLISEGIIFSDEKPEDDYSFLPEMIRSNDFKCLWNNLSPDDKNFLGLDIKAGEMGMFASGKKSNLTYKPANYFDDNIEKVLAERKRIVEEYAKKGFSILKISCTGEETNAVGISYLLPETMYEFYQPGILAKYYKPGTGNTKNVAQTTNRVLVPFRTKNFKYIFVDSATMQPVLTKPYSRLYPFKNGLARAENTYVGFINELGEEVVPLQFEQLFDHFESGVAIMYHNGGVSMYDKYGLIDRKGKTIMPMGYSSIFYAYNGIFIVQDKYSYMGYGENYYVNAAGEKIIDKTFDKAGYFSDGLAAIKKKDERYYTYIDVKGNEKITANFTEAEPFHSGLAAVKIEGKWGYINKAGKLVIPAQYTAVKSFQNNIAVVKDDSKLYTFIDKNGKQLFNEKYQYADVFRDGMALVTKDQKVGFINAKGETKIPFIYVNAKPFANGLALVVNDKDIKKFQVINKQGEVIYASKDKLGLDAFDSGIYMISTADDSYFFIDRAGREYKE